MRKLLVTLAGAALLVIPAQQAQAQLTAGPAVAYHDDFDLGVGGYILTPLESLHENISLEGDFLYFFPDEGGFGGFDVNYYEINANLVWSFPIDAAVTPFALGGLNVARASIDEDFGGIDFGYGDTEVGLNLGGGITFGGEDASIRPVVGGKIELNGGDGFVIFAGLGFPLGG